MTDFLRGEVSDWTVSNTSLTLTLPVTTQVGDLVVLVHTNDYFTLSYLTTPTGTAVTTWAERTDARYDGGTNACHIKVWTGAVTTGGAATVIANYPPDWEERYAHAFVFVDAAYDAGVSTAQASSTTWNSGSVSATSADSYLIVSAIGSAAGNTNFTFPGSMTALTEYDQSTFSTVRSGWEHLTASGSTGTRAIGLSPAISGATCSLVVKSTTTAAPTPIPGRRQSSTSRRRAANW